jgi:hypothetical protein
MAEIPSQYERLAKILESQDWYYHYAEGPTYIAGRESYHALERLLNTCWANDPKKTSEVVSEYFCTHIDNDHFVRSAGQLLSRFMEVE